MNEQVIDPDFDIYWRLHFPRFERFLRDEMTVETIDGEFDNTLLRKTARVLLKICEVKSDSILAASFPISVSCFLVEIFVIIFVTL